MAFLSGSGEQRVRGCEKLQQSARTQKQDFEVCLLWQACYVWSCEWSALLRKKTGFKTGDKTQTIRTNEPCFIVMLGMSVCYLVKVAPGVTLMGFNVERRCWEGQRAQSLMHRVVHHLLGMRNTDPKKNTHDSHAPLRIQRTTRTVQSNINYMIHEGLWSGSEGEKHIK